MLILAIDPGTYQSAYVLWNGEQLLKTGIMLNHELYEVFVEIQSFVKFQEIHTYIEGFEPRGNRIDQNCIDTIWWAGQFYAWCHFFQLNPSRIPRGHVKKHFKVKQRHTHNADTQIRQALIEKYGPKPTKSYPNPVYSTCRMAADIWQAWALAVMMWKLMQDDESTRGIAPVNS